MSITSCQTLAQALEQYYTVTLSEVPEALRQRALQCQFVTLLWDESCVAQRRQLIARLEAEHDPQTQREFACHFWDFEMDASVWWQLSAVNAEEAAALLSGPNPITAAQQDCHTGVQGAINHSDTEWHASFARLLRKFTDVNLQKPESRTLAQWLHIAQQAKLKYDAWIDEWLEAGGTAYSAESALVAEDSSQAVGQTNSMPRGITKQQLIAAFQDCHYSARQWSKYSASPPKWLLEARLQKGGKSRRSLRTLWNPVLVATALIDKKIRLAQLDLIFVKHRSLHGWADTWQEASAMFR